MTVSEDVPEAVHGGRGQGAPTAGLVWPHGSAVGGALRCRVGEPQA